MNPQERPSSWWHDSQQRMSGSDGTGLRSESLSPEAARLLPILSRAIALGRGPAGLMSWLHDRLARPCESTWVSPESPADMNRMAREVANLLDRPPGEEARSHSHRLTIAPNVFNTVSSPVSSDSTGGLKVVETAEQCAPAARPGKRTILLAEDNAGVRNLIRHVLKTNGYELLEARHGQEALLVSDKHGGAIDLLITDVVMPQMGGCQLAELLVARRPGIKVLFLSGHLDDILPESKTEMDSAFLHKPFSPAELVQMVKQLVGE
jgi:CheY-like chemotaxis protein